LSQFDSPDFRKLVASVFTGEPVDDAVLARLRTGAIEEWVGALDRSGLFGRELVAGAEQRWRESPRSLLETLLIESDDMTRRRWLAAWDGDRSTQRLIS
jgi:hypothetical protein